ncbi:MAG: hypothetical protein Q9199_005767, partial [Rusavskia elegans]
MCWTTGTVLITGVRRPIPCTRLLSDREQAAGGIGEETAFTFAQGGIPAIAFADIDKQKAGKVAETSKSLATNSDYCTFVVAVDVTDPTSVQRMVDETVDNDSYAPTYDSAVEDFDNVMNVNANGVLTFIRAVSKTMLAQDSRTAKSRSGTRDVGRGSIVNLGSANSYGAIPGKVIYVASKHATIGITKTT